MNTLYRERPTSGTVTRQLALSSATLTEHHYRASFQLQKHSHTSSFLTFVLHGTYLEDIGSTSQECRPRTVRFLPAGELHANRYGAETRCMHVEIQDPILDEIRQASRLRLSPGLVRAPGATAIAARLYRELVSADDLSALSAQALTTELLIESCRGMDASTRPPRWLARVDELLHDRFAEKLALQQIAQAADVHVAHLCREFHRHHHCTIGEFVRHLRVERAALLLAESNRVIADIAQRVGCSDQSHLISMFKKQMGMTPGKYRALFRRQN